MTQVAITKACSVTLQHWTVSLLLPYYRDKAAKGINLILEQGGVLNPIEKRRPTPAY